MALYGGARDTSLFRYLNRELLWDTISQQCAIYQLKDEKTKVNMYGEVAGARFYNEPVLLNALIDRGDNTAPTGEMGVDYGRPMTFKFFRDDLVDANIVPEVGDIIMWYANYFEINNVTSNQLFVGKDPAYPYDVNPLNPGLENFGSSISVLCAAHYVPADKVQVTRERLQ
jgi:hypothetical protein